MRDARRAEIAEVAEIVASCIARARVEAWAQWGGGLQEKITVLEEKIRSLEAQNRVLRELASRPPTVIDQTETLRIMVEGLKNIIAPPIIVTEEQTRADEGPRDSPIPAFWPDVEFDPNMMPTRGGWVNQDSNGKPMFTAGSGNTQPPHAGGIVE